MYIDDVLIFSKKKYWIDTFIRLLSEGCEKFELTDEGNIDKYLRVDTTTYYDGSYELKQPFLIKRIVNELNLLIVDSQKHTTPVATLLLHKDLAGQDRIKP